MIHIPDNLPLKVAPLTWLLGTWQGWGVYTDAPSATEKTAATAPASTCLLEYSVQVEGDQLRLQKTVWRTQPGVVLDNEAPVAQGLSALEKTSLAWQTSGYWELAPHEKLPNGMLIQATSSSSTGNVSLWQGTVQGPRAQLTLDVSAGAAQARSLEHGQLLLGIVKSELFLVESLQFKGSEITLSGRLAKVHEADPIPLLPDGPPLAGVINE
ncbi:heme-binding beta-barrel domain-containing protein [Gleimia sp. 6138-11-ORH1]|uniref:heme-binding beta-barrel domain-containing protein n=1 Tax=Gleimia sp. 6138-11-ORH1 TaxID=2973937 RepID=UPI002168A173|nr:heme-binding beta-barrel domain-containing protein [Gleimia sp. 6138-11-ORH1]MCS4484686.1 heme-binding beta-barrel domain-containing protein [Gleimia sp. 6138-11-ORH1]